MVMAMRLPGNDRPWRSWVDFLARPAMLAESIAAEPWRAWLHAVGFAAVAGIGSIAIFCFSRYFLQRYYYVDAYYKEAAASLLGQLICVILAAAILSYLLTFLVDLAVKRHGVRPMQYARALTLVVGYLLLLAALSVLLSDGLQWVRPDEDFGNLADYAQIAVYGLAAVGVVWVVNSLSILLQRNCGVARVVTFLVHLSTIVAATALIGPLLELPTL
jgi:hypothetical protein